MRKITWGNHCWKKFVCVTSLWSQHCSNFSPLCFVYFFLYSTEEVQCSKATRQKKKSCLLYSQASHRFILFWEWCAHTTTVEEYFWSSFTTIFVSAFIFSVMLLFLSLCSKGGGLHFCVVILVGHRFQRLLLYRMRSFPWKPFSFSFCIFGFHQLLFKYLHFFF